MGRLLLVARMSVGYRWDIGGIKLLTLRLFTLSVVILELLTLSVVTFNLFETVVR